MCYNTEREYFIPLLQQKLLKFVRLSLLIFHTSPFFKSSTTLWGDRQIRFKTTEEGEEGNKEQATLVYYSMPFTKSEVSLAEHSVCAAECNLTDDVPLKNIQKNTITRWCNKHLKCVNRFIDDLQFDLNDGLTLIALLEVLSHKKMFRKYHTRPTFRQMRLDNVSAALEFLEQENVKMMSIGKGHVEMLRDHFQSGSQAKLRKKIKSHFFGYTLHEVALCRYHIYF